MTSDELQQWLPGFNASLNALSGGLVVIGWLAIKGRRVAFHKACMLSALGVSALFLACYLFLHIVLRGGQPTRFAGPDEVRPVYFTILISHTILAALVAPLALYVAYQGLRGRLERHVKLARWTMPIWIYVSVTGVIVYWMLYRMYPPANG